MASSCWKPAMGERRHVFLLSSIRQTPSATVISPVIPVPSSDSNKGVFHVRVESRWPTLWIFCPGLLGDTKAPTFNHLWLLWKHRNSRAEGICPATANSRSSARHSRKAPWTHENAEIASDQKKDVRVNRAAAWDAKSFGGDELCPAK